MDKWIEEEGRTKEEAIGKGLRRLNLEETDVEVEMVEEGKRFLGLIGGRSVKVRIRYNPLQCKMTGAKKALEKILEGMGFEASVLSSIENTSVHLNVKSEDGSLLIGRKGQTIDALQYIVNRIVNRSPEDKVKVIVDTEDYRERHNERIRRLAQRLALKVKSTGQPVTMPPMNSYERRIIHMTLQSDSGVRTTSKGEGMLKKVRISPKRWNNED